jgi:hypothetical protein
MASCPSPAFCLKKFIQRGERGGRGDKSTTGWMKRREVLDWFGSRASRLRVTRLAPPELTSDLWLLASGLFGCGCVALRSLRLNVLAAHPVHPPASCLKGLFNAERGNRKKAHDSRRI